MEFVDNTGHIFSLPSFNTKPIGYEYEENDYVFWVNDDSLYRLSVNNYYIKTIYLLYKTDNFDNFNNGVDIEIYFNNSSIYNLVSPIKMQEKISKLDDINDILDFDDNDIKLSKITNDDLYVIYTKENNQSYAIIPLYIICTSSQEGTWLSNLMIYVKNYIEHNEEWCPITLGSMFVDEYEELIINGQNMGISLPKDIIKAVYSESFFNDEYNVETYNRKLKEYLLNYVGLRSELGNYNSVIKSLNWFEYGDKIILSKLFKTDNDIVNQYVRDYFNTENDIIKTFNKFKLDSLISLTLMINKELEETYPIDFSTGWLMGENKPKLVDLLDYYEKIKIGNHDMPIEDDIEKYFYWKPYFDFSFNELGIKLAYLKYYYKKYFLPIHLNIHNASLGQRVFTNDIKMSNYSQYNYTLPIISTYNSDNDIEFLGNGLHYFTKQIHYIDDNFNEFDSTYMDQNDNTVFYELNDTCINIPISFTSNKLYNCIFLLERQNYDKIEYIHYINKEIKISLNIDKENSKYDYKIDSINLYYNKESIDLDKLKFAYKYVNDNLYSEYFDGINKLIDHICKNIYKTNINSNDTYYEKYINIKFRSDKDKFDFFLINDETIEDNDIYLRNKSDILLETHFSFYNKEDNYKNFILYPKKINIKNYIETNFFEYWINSSYILKVCINNKWYEYEFKTAISRPVLDFGRLSYKYYLNNIQSIINGNIKNDEYSHYLLMLNNEDQINNMEEQINRQNSIDDWELLYKEFNVDDEKSLIVPVDNNNELFNTIIDYNMLSFFTQISNIDEDKISFNAYMNDPSFVEVNHINFDIDLFKILKYNLENNLLYVDGELINKQFYRYLEYYSYLNMYDTKLKKYFENKANNIYGLPCYLLENNHHKKIYIKCKYDEYDEDENKYLIYDENYNFIKEWNKTTEYIISFDLDNRNINLHILNTYENEWFLLDENNRKIQLNVYDRVNEENHNEYLFIDINNYVDIDILLIEHWEDDFNTYNRMWDYSLETAEKTNPRYINLTKKIYKEIYLKYHIYIHNNLFGKNIFVNRTSLSNLKNTLLCAYNDDIYILREVDKNNNTYQIVNDSDASVLKTEDGEFLITLESINFIYNSKLNCYEHNGIKYTIYDRLYFNEDYIYNKYSYKPNISNNLKYLNNIHLFELYKRSYKYQNILKFAKDIDLTVNGVNFKRTKRDFINDSDDVNYYDVFEISGYLYNTNIESDSRYPDIYGLYWDHYFTDENKTKYIISGIYGDKTFEFIRTKDEDKWYLYKLNTKTNKYKEIPINVETTILENGYVNYKFHNVDGISFIIEQLNNAEYIQRDSNNRILDYTINVITNSYKFLNLKEDDIGYQNYGLYIKREYSDDKILSEWDELKDENNNYICKTNEYYIIEENEYSLLGKCKFDTLDKFYIGDKDNIKNNKDFFGELYVDNDMYLWVDPKKENMMENTKYELFYKIFLVKDKIEYPMNAELVYSNDFDYVLIYFYYKKKHLIKNKYYTLEEFLDTKLEDVTKECGVYYFTDDDNNKIEIAPKYDKEKYEGEFLTKDEVFRYNVKLEGALDNETPLTKDQAEKYNNIFRTSKIEGNILTYDEAYEYNLKIQGSLSKRPLTKEEAISYNNNREYYIEYKGLRINVLKVSNIQYYLDYNNNSIKIQNPSGYWHNVDNDNNVPINVDQALNELERYWFVENEMESYGNTIEEIEEQLSIYKDKLEKSTEYGLNMDNSIELRYRFKNYLVKNITGIKGEFQIKWEVINSDDSNNSDNLFNLCVCITRNDGTINIYNENEDIFYLYGNEQEVLVYFRLNTKDYFRNKIDKFEVHPMIMSRIESNEKLAYNINDSYDLENGDTIKIRINNREYIYGDNSSEFVINLYNQFFKCKYNLYDISLNNRNKLVNSNFIYSIWDYNDNIKLSDDTKYDFYLMHDNEYWYGLYISRLTCDQISNKDLKINNEDKKLILNNDYVLKYVRSGKEFLINRMDFNSNNGYNHFNLDDLIAVKMTNNDRLPIRSDISSKWKITNMSLGMDLSSEFESDAETTIISMPMNDNKYEKGYYNITVRYSLDRDLQHQFKDSGTIRVS